MEFPKCSDIMLLSKLISAIAVVVVSGFLYPNPISSKIFDAVLFTPNAPTTRSGS